MEIVKGITEKIDGNMRITIPTCAKNRETYFHKVGLNPDNLFMASLVHGNRVVMIDEKNKDKIQQNCDALVTNLPNTILGVTAADCLPIYFWNKQKTIIGIAHAGWRGVKSEIVKEVIKTFTKDFSVKIEDILIEIGPHILDCHFEIQADLIEIFSAYPETVKIVNSKKYLDLQNIVEKQLVSVGVNKSNIKKTTACTYCDNTYFSYRRDRPEITEAMLAYITLKK
jgi:YfiH family protein